MGIVERKKREKDLRRQQIQDAAKRLFIQKGLNFTTVEDIANLAEVSPATIYLYFKNKDELYVSLNLITLEYLFNEIKKVYDNKKLTNEEKILRFKNAMYKTFKYEPLILRNIFRIQLEDILPAINRELVKKINQIAREIMMMMANVYEEGVSRGKFIEGHRMAHADIIWGLFAGLVLWEESKRSLNPRKDYLKSTLDTAFEIYCRGIRKK
jgi:AcrR family transcriptional regulator